MLITHPNLSRECPPKLVSDSPTPYAVACASCNRSFERKQPAGTKIFAFDGLIIVDGMRTVHASGASAITCNRNGITVSDPESHRRWVFTQHVHIALVRGYKEEAVKPGEVMSDELRRNLKLGVAYFKKTI
jgi:hypothetical protein